MKINIDKQAGFCPGVVRTVNNVEAAIADSGTGHVFIIGEIIHNPQETLRLQNLGLITVTIENITSLPVGSTIIIRAHGEPPSTYDIIMESHLRLIDATCPLVRNLQHKVGNYYKSGYNIIIFGKKDHPEVVGLRGVCADTCTVISDYDLIPQNLDTGKDTVLLSQTTSDLSKFEKLYKKISDLFRDAGTLHLLKTENTICVNVSSRERKLKEFVAQNDVTVFVAGRNSSNGQSLYNTCCSVSKKVYFIESDDELKKEWFRNADNIGITGATSTPKWFLHETGTKIEHLLNY